MTTDMSIWNRKKDTNLKMEVLARGIHAGYTP
jgi:hypothetical protein